MGNAIWIFLGIAILQAIVGGIAKSAEKRKKAEAAQRMLEASKDGGRGSAMGPVSNPISNPISDPTASDPPRVPVAVDTRKESSSSVRSRLEELRKKRLEVLRRRSGPDAGVTAAVDPKPRRTRTTLADPPPAATAVNAPVPARGADARAADRSPTRASTPNAQTAPSLRRESRTAGPGPRSGNHPAAKAARPSSGSGQSGSTAASLRGRLRTSKGFREALLLGELLKPPVGLRPPGGEPG